MRIRSAADLDDGLSSACDRTVFLVDDGDTVCPACITRHRDDVLAAMVDRRNDGWRVLEAFVVSPTEEEACCVCDWVSPAGHTTSDDHAADPASVGARRR